MQIDILIAQCKKSNILFLKNCPLIYPLLDYIDVLLGDFSSIGYDFLTFNKPMFIFKSDNEKLSSDLFNIATMIEDENIYETIEKNMKNDKREEKIKKLYNYTFDKIKNFNNLKKMVFE